MKNKICTKCKKLKTLNNFYYSKSKGYYSHCKNCHSILTVKWYVINKKSHDERNKKWYTMNKEKHNKNSKIWYKENPEKALNTYLKRYKITLNDFNKLLKKQGNKCEICKIDTNKLNRRISVDHCHKTGNIRGLLCQNCNRALGFLKDDINIVKTALKYLKKHYKEINK